MDAPAVGWARRTLCLVVVATLLCSLGTGVAAAQSVQGVGGTVIVDGGETVESVEVVAGTVLIRGTVTGDVAGTAGTVHVTETGRVGGDVEAAAGTVRIDGTVDGDVAVAAGSLVVSETGRIGGRLEAGAGYVSVDGRVDGDVQVGAETVELGPNARVGGDVRYDAARFSRDPGATVGGQVVREPGEATRRGPTPAGSVIVVGYGLLANLFLGSILLLAFPGFSAAVERRVAERPARTAGVGLLALVGAPLALLVTLLTVVGIPLALLGAVLFAGALWVGSVYGQYAVGARVLAAVGMETGWLALVGGLLGFAVLGLVPVLGPLFHLLALLFGLGALALGLREAYGPRTVDGDGE